MTTLETLLRNLSDDDFAPHSGADPHGGPARHRGDGLADRVLLRARHRARARRAIIVTAAGTMIATIAAVGVVVHPASNRQVAAGHSGSSAADPWAARPQENVLLLGSDAAPDRTGTRVDTMIVANIDTTTGRTLLVSLPRNLTHAPFPPGTPQARAYPHGFTCRTATGEDPCVLSSVWTWGETNAGRYFPGDPRPGITATLQAVEQLTGLRMDDYVVLDMRGLVQIVDALGGVTVNVRERLPIGGSATQPRATGGFIDPGRQHLDGYHALWFARSRWSTDDYSRMLRQRCVIGAIAAQVTPAHLAEVLPGLATLVKQHLQMSIPLTRIGAWLTLAGKVRHAEVRSLVITNRQIDPANPDVAELRHLVTQATTPTAAKVTPSGTTTGTPSDKITDVC